MKPIIKTGYWPVVVAGIYLMAAPASAGATLEVHEYTISVDYALNRLWVEARFATPITSISARSSDAGKFLVDVRDCDSDQSIRLRNRRMMLPDSGVRCINYTVDLARAARQDKNYRDLAASNVVVSPTLWLWRPEITRRSEIRAKFRLPNDVQVSVPWRKVDGTPDTYRLTRSPESSNAPVIFGKFDYHEVGVPGATLRVSLLRGKTAIDQEAVLDWIRLTATDISAAYGRFPNPAPQIIVVPVTGNRSNSAVSYSQVIRDGGETVQLFINPDKTLAEFMGDGKATHEFSHLMLPYLNQRHRWVSEGFAQYYENILLARTGIYEDLYAWQKLYDGFESGRESRPELSPNSAAEGGIRTGRMKVNWSGAAIALMADVQLRERSGGVESLDTVLGRLQQCCLPADRMWSGIELFEKLDSLITAPVFMPLYRRYANTAGFPDTSELFARLGLSVSDGTVHIRRNGELRKIRSTITGASTAGSSRNQLAAR